MLKNILLITTALLSLMIVNFAHAYAGPAQIQNDRIITIALPQTDDQNSDTSQEQDDADATQQQLHDGERAQNLSDQEEQTIQHAQDQYEQAQAELHITPGGDTNTLKNLHAQLDEDTKRMQEHAAQGRNLEAQEDTARIKRDEQQLKQAEAKEYRNDSDLSEYNDSHPEVVPQRFSDNLNTNSNSSSPAPLPDKTIAKRDTAPENDPSALEDW